MKYHHLYVLIDRKVSIQLQTQMELLMKNYLEDTMDLQKEKHLEMM